MEIKEASRSFGVKLNSMSSGFVLEIVSGSFLVDLLILSQHSRCLVIIFVSKLDKTEILCFFPILSFDNMKFE